MTKPPPERLTQILAVRVKPELRSELDSIKDYEGANGAVEMCRSWIIERVSTYRNNPRYLAWKKARDTEEAEAEKKRRIGQRELA